MNRFLAEIAGILALLTMLFTPTHADTMDDVIKRGTFRVGVAQESFLPWIGRGPSGSLFGYEIDVATDLARVLSVKPEFVEIPFSDLLSMLTNGNIDVIFSGYTITTDRARSVLFSKPYSWTEYWLVVDTSALPEGAKEGDYDAEGYKIGVMAGKVSEELALGMFVKSEIKSFYDEATARDALDKGEINAIVAPTPYPTFMMLRHPDRYAIGSDALFGTSQAIAVRIDSLRFVNFIDAWITENKVNGRNQQAQDYWFGSLDWESRL
jgi:polar amino acid transport system substrate-binding protein